MKPTSGYIVGITGNIGAGKSTVSSYIRDKGYEVIDADKIARDIVEKNSEGYLKVVDFFGRGILDGDLNIDRKKLGDIVFTCREKLMKLNEITHPLIFKEIRERLKDFKGDIIFIDLPLLYEAYDELRKWDIDFYKVILIYVDPSIQLKRIMERDNIGKEAAMSKINSQMDQSLKLSRADIVIENNRGIEDLILGVDLILQKLLSNIERTRN